jgi:hypothetical protein
MLTSAAVGQAAINANNSLPVSSGGQIADPASPSFASVISGNPSVSFDANALAASDLTPGTISANQNIGYNTIPQLLTATPPTGGAPPYSYQWQSSLNSSVFYDLSGATTLNYQSGPLTATTWYRQVQFSKGGGDSVYTNVISIMVYGYAVEELVSANQRVYPNPTEGYFIVELKDEAPVDMVKVDVVGPGGEKILSDVMYGERKHAFSLSDKPAGVYLIRMTSGNRVETVKIIKQ